MNYPHDERLDLLNVGEYRIWHDGQDILIPVGQSTTKPLSKENVPANTRVYGEIRKGYFIAPEVDFTNAEVYTKRFDKFGLQIWRTEIPQGDIDLHEDLRLNALKISYSMLFACKDAKLTGKAQGVTWLNYDSDGVWVSQEFTFKEHNNTHIRGNVIIACDTNDYLNSIGQSNDTGASVQENALPINVIINEVFAVNGNSSMRLLTKNSLFPVTLEECVINIIGGE